MSEEIQKRLTEAVEHWQPIYRKAREDQDFLSDDPDAQWEEADFMARRNAGRPALTIDLLEQFVNQVTNDIRMNTPSVNVIPKGGEATLETAEVFKGIIKDIEYQSNADSAYDTAAGFSVESSIGYLAVDHEYEDEETGTQRACIKRVTEPHLIFLDPASKEADGSDAEFGFRVVPVSFDEFKRRWPKHEPVSIKVDGIGTPPDKHVYVAEYFNVREQKYVEYELEDGTIGEATEGDELASISEIISSRKAIRRFVERQWIGGDGTLGEMGQFPGRYVPLIPVYGKERWRNGRRELYSLVRKSKDSSRMHNYWASIECELLMKQPKAPVIAAEGSTEDYADDYLHPDKAAVLRYRPYDDQGRQLPAPQLSTPTAIPAGIVNARQEAANDVRATMGLYDAFLGQKSNEVSGKAINARKQEGNRAVYHFSDNLVRAITHVGRILVDIIPILYDTPRIVGIIGKEDTAEVVGINGALVPGQKETYDLRKGKYGVRVTTGASYATMRQEAADFFEQVVMTSPEMLDKIGDLVFKYMDFPGSQAVAERMRRFIGATSPQLLGDEEDGQVAALAQELQAAQVQIEQLTQQIKDKREENILKSQVELDNNEVARQNQAVEVQRLQVDLELARLESQTKMAELALKQQELKVRELELMRPEENGQSRPETSGENDNDD